jgi:hypothetical protein
MGPKASSGWMAANADSHTYWSTNQDGTLEFTLNEGNYHPIRIVHDNSHDGPANMDLSITTPDATVILRVRHAIYRAVFL